MASNENITLTERLCCSLEPKEDNSIQKSYPRFRRDDEEIEQPRCP